jgi:two-component system response regulator YesN
MYKVFFVDDEASMRAGIRDGIDWDNSSFTLAGEAPDGEMALALMQEIMPDILLTDVRMPFMDGLELSRIVKKTMPWIKIIIVSGHDEFEYAKQAIAIGVEDYLLKPVTSGKLMETLDVIAARIEVEKERLRNVEELIEGTKKVKIEKLVSDMLYGSVDVGDAAATAKELGLDIVGDYYLVMNIELHRSYDEGYNYSYNASECALGVLKGWGNTVYTSQGPERIVCVLKGQDSAALEEDAFTCAHALKYEVERNGPCLVAVAIGSIVADIKDWPKSLADAEVLRRYLDSKERNQIASAAGSKYTDIVIKAQEYIMKNFASKDISLHSVAKEVNISPNHFSTVFSQETGETFISYISRVRLEQAKALLKTTQMRTSDVGYEVGYNDTHYFSYVFKKNTGMTPKEYRGRL